MTAQTKIVPLRLFYCPARPVSSSSQKIDILFHQVIEIAEFINLIVPVR